MSFLTTPLFRQSSSLSASMRRTFTTTSPQSLARLSIIGRLGASPELATSSNGKEYMKYNIATTTGLPDAQGNPRTSWFRIMNFNPGEEASRGREYLLGLEKGTLVYLEGDASISNYQDPDTGKTHSNLGVIQRRLEVLKRGSSASNPAEGEEGAAFEG